MAIELNSDGWSKKLLRYTRSGWDRKYDKNPCTDDSYDTFGYTNKTQYNWYTKSYWNRWTLARKFKNVTDTAIILKQMTFNAAPAHSNGKYATVSTTNADGTHKQYIFDGEGCVFYCDIFFEGSPNYNSSTGLYTPDFTSKGGQMKKIYSPNCHVTVDGVARLGETDVSLGAPPCTTYFGQHAYYQTATDKNGTTLGMQKIVLEFAEEVRVEPGQAIYLVIRNPEGEWTSTGSNDGGSAIECTGGSWESIVEPTQSGYIWVMTDTGWQKVKLAHQMTASGWQPMEEV